MFLGQVQTVYQLSHDIDVGRFQTLLECFTSTFETVKLLAFDLLMKLPKTVVQSQVFGLFLCKCVCMKTWKQQIKQSADCPGSLHLPSFIFWLFWLSLTHLLLWGGGIGGGGGGNIVRENKVRISELCFFVLIKTGGVGSSRFYCLRDDWQISVNCGLSSFLGHVNSWSKHITYSNLSKKFWDNLPAW